MHRYECSYEDAKRAPDGVLDIVPENHDLTVAEIEYGQKVAERLFLELDEAKEKARLVAEKLLSKLIR